MFSIFWPFSLASGIFRLLLNVLVFSTCILTITAFLGDRGWLWSLSTHFRAQYLAIQLTAFVLASFSYWRKRPPEASKMSKIDQWVSLLVLGCFLGLNLAVVIPYYVPVKPAELSGNPLKLMHFNVFGNVNRQTQAVISAIQAEEPDLIDLVEYTEPWRKALEQSKVLKKYPYRLSGKANIALYSKRPLNKARLVYSGSQKMANQANIIAQVTMNNQPVTILVAHPASPIQPSHLVWLQESFATWRKERHRLGKNLIVVGDLNTSPWSAEFERLTETTGLRDSQLGFGLQPTWPMLLPILGIKQEPNWLTQALQIPIDHVLVSEQLVVTGRHTGPFVGSDHLPVTVELSLGKAGTPFPNLAPRVVSTGKQAFNHVLHVSHPVRALGHDTVGRLGSHLVQQE